MVNKPKPKISADTFQQNEMKKSVKIDKTPDFRGFNFEEKKGKLIDLDKEYIVRKE